MQQRIEELRVVEIAVALDCARPPDRVLTRAEALHLLKPKLMEMQARGHTAESISAALSTQGLDYSERQVAAQLRVPRVPHPNTAPVKRARTTRRDGVSNCAATTDQEEIKHG